MELAGLAELARPFDFFKAEPCLPREAIVAGLCPPLLVSDGSLVWGCAYVDAALGAVPEGGGRCGPGAAGIRLPVELVPGLSASEQLIALLLRERRCGAYSFAETAAIGRAAAGCAAADAGLPGRAASDLGLMDRVSLLTLGTTGLSALLERLDALPAQRRLLAETGIADLKTVERCRSLPELAAARFALFAKGLSASERRLALGWFDDIALRDSLEPAAAAALVDTIARIEPVPERLGALRARRYPELSHMEAQFKLIGTDRLKGSRVLLEPPQNFEGAGYRLSFVFSSAAELERRLRAAAVLEKSAAELMGLIE